MMPTAPKIRLLTGFEATRAFIEARPLLDEYEATPALRASIERLFGEALTPDQVVERILRELTTEVGSRSAELVGSLEALGELDYYRASAALSRDLGATCPILNSEGRLRIRGARHPILLQTIGARGGKVVPLDMVVGEGARTLVISGPNAGGKTVTLKTVGVLTLMAQSGLHVPADADTELSVFRDIYADIGDEQSIEQSLSTFSSHILTIGRIVRASTGSSLVLLDEVGVGTDPVEGARWTASG